MFQVYIVLPGRTPKHPRCRLTAIAVSPVFANSMLRMVRAEINSFDMSPPQVELLEHPVCDLMEISLCIIPSPNTRLVGHHNHQIAGSVRSKNNVEDALNKIEILLPDDIAMVNIDYAVAIEK